MHIEEHHYGENVSKIKLDGIAPFANSYNFDVAMYLQNKKLKKKLKNGMILNLRGVGYKLIK